MQTRYFIYCMVSDYTLTKNIRKIGYTTNPIKRIQSGNTCIPPIPGFRNFYECIWEMNLSSIQELEATESLVHKHFEHLRLKDGDEWTEWFMIDFDLIKSYISSLEYVKATIRDINSIGLIESKPKNEIVKSEISQLTKSIYEKISQEDALQSALSRQEDFFQTFLPVDAKPRKIQSELWTIFSKILIECQSYRGIIQWATGTGKTVATMMLFYLIATSKTKTHPFRALLIAPTNDIFETIMKHIRKLSRWGITILEGHNASLSTLTVPTDCPILVTATHASLTDIESWNRLPPMTHIHYDEVHRATGTEFFTCLKMKLDEWGTPYLTGTSATPKTCSTLQQEKLGELFGNPYNIIHKCDIAEAISQQYIAKPRFTVNVVSKDNTISDQINLFINSISEAINQKIRSGNWKGGKVIAYIPDKIEKVQAAVQVAQAANPSWKIYSAVEGSDADTDTNFVKHEADGTVRILFACQRYREGSDIYGLEMTCIFMGESIAANILLQIAGRALRLDYPEKEGWCMIMRPSEEGMTEEDVLDQIVLTIIDFCKDNDELDKASIKKTIDAYFGQITVNGRLFDIDTTINRLQTLYLRREPKIKYETMRALNKSMNLQSRVEYIERATEHPKFIEDPEKTFGDDWISWYHYLGIDCSRFPATKEEFIYKCRASGLLTWASYKETSATDLPKNPGEMYNDFTQWDKEFGIEDELVW